MKCPITRTRQEIELGDFKYKGGDCLKGKCACFDKEKKQCLAQTIKEDLSAIANALINLSKTATLHTGVWQ